jgi:hypothetical protein
LVSDVERKRLVNERKFPHREELATGGRRYWYVTVGKFGFEARYIKEVDEREDTTRFSQEIYDSEGNLVEIHEKFPVDLGHRRLRWGKYES